MQKQFLLNTLLLIGAICLSTRGMAADTQETTPTNQSHYTTQAQPTTTAATDAMAAPSQQQYVSATSNQSASHDDANEEMD